MTIDRFLIDMIDTGEVLVDARQLREYIQSRDRWIKLAEDQANTISKLLNRIDTLEAKIIAQELQNPIKIDLKV